jgi:hypothetical protein
MPLLSGRTPARAAALWAFLFHAGAALWLWARWGEGVRSGLLFWLDLPLSFAWAGLGGRLFLFASLLFGGLWWALVAAALVWLVGRAARRRTSLAGEA